MSLHLITIGSKRTPCKLLWDIRHEGFSTPLQKPPFFFPKKYHGTFRRLTQKILRTSDLSQTTACCGGEHRRYKMVWVAPFFSQQGNIPGKKRTMPGSWLFDLFPLVKWKRCDIQTPWSCRISNRHDCRFVSEASIRNKCCGKLKRKKAFGHLG